MKEPNTQKKKRRRAQPLKKKKGAEGTVTRAMRATVRKGREEVKIVLRSLSTAHRGERHGGLGSMRGFLNTLKKGNGGGQAARLIKDQKRLGSTETVRHPIVHFWGEKGK